MRVGFSHGLGDCAYFAHQLPLYVRRNHKLTVACHSDKAILFRASGVEVTNDFEGARSVPWNQSTGLDRIDRNAVWIANKPTVNLGISPMPSIGSPSELWRESCEVRLDLRPYISLEDWTAVKSFLRLLPRPVILLHTKGNTSQESKSLSDELTLNLYRCLLDSTQGCIILLDWDNRVPRLASFRVRHLTDDWDRITLSRLMALLYEADLMMGIDSGPLHAARFTDIAAIGMFPSVAHHPALYCLPRSRQVNVVPHDGCHDLNKRSRIAFNIVESPGKHLSAEFLATLAAQSLSGARYLSESHLGADIQLQQFVRDWERGYPNALSTYVDRHQSYDRLFVEIKRRFIDPIIVETGCIRAEEDWRGAGFSTYLFATLLHRRGGKLVSLDNRQEHINFAAKMTGEMGCVNFRCADSVECLRSFDGRIDVLVLDSLDTTVAGHADHALLELQAALPFLHPQSLVLLDDTVYKSGAFHGKGEKAVPWLISNGWRIMYSGYQTLLERT